MTEVSVSLSCFQLRYELAEDLMRQFGGVDFVGVGDFYASFVGDVYEVLAGLVEELGVYGFLFRVVVPVPDFHAVAGGVGDYGFAFESSVVA